MVFHEYSKEESFVVGFSSTFRGCGEISGRVVTSKVCDFLLEGKVSVGGSL